MSADASKKVPAAIAAAKTINKTAVKRVEKSTENIFINLIEASDYTVSIKDENNCIISGSTLKKNYDKTMALVQELLLEPRWDEKEFDLIKQSTLAQVERQKAQPNNIARNEFQKLLYGENHLLSHDNLGTKSSINAITISDLKAYYNYNFSPDITKLHVVGSISKEKVTKSLVSLNSKWQSKPVEFPRITNPLVPNTSKVYFYDVPGAKQSVLTFGYPALAATDIDYYPAQLLNYRLGGGSFASQLTQQLREGKGYTYGIGSRFSGSTMKGSFSISSGVRTNVTYESSSLVKEILKNYGKNYNENDLEVTKGYMIKSNARAFETLRSKLTMLTNISNYGYADDYAKEREDIVKAMTVEDIKALAEKYFNPEKMIYLVVGDAASQMDKLEGLGFGKPELLNELEIEETIQQ